MATRDKERAERYGFTSRKTKRTAVIVELIREALEARARPPAALEQVSPIRPTRHPSGNGKKARETQNRVANTARRVKREEPKTRRKLAPARKAAAKPRAKARRR